ATMSFQIQLSNSQGGRLCEERQRRPAVARLTRAMARLESAEALSRVGGSNPESRARLLESSLALAMKPCDTPPSSRGAIASELCIKLVPRKTEGAGKTGRWLHPQPDVQLKKHTSKVTTGSTGTSGLPCAMVYSLLRALVSAKSARMCERAVLTKPP